MSDSFVKVWQEKVVIPTYRAGAPDKNPMFFEKRVYQGSSGVVYPNPVIEKIHDERTDMEYTALFLENAYLKIMILPELGGRVQMAYDKIRQRHFIYYNQVIKPALVGLCGPWISGGIEFNWPQHHRPSTFSPVDFSIEDNGDGSKTVWINEVERMSRTKGMAGFTLHPGRAYLEINVKLFNRTPLPQTFLWWANPAVKVNDDYQSVFPPDVNAVFDHGKRDVSSFPIATGTYYKVNYSPGTDISRYKNIPVPTSYMAIHSDYDFVGGYEHDSKAGLLHVADHHVSPGKKQWTWGHGDFGQAWDRNLTDEDGPYIELMTGVYTDNQPDFTWLMPFEEKSFTQYFLPYRELGVVKNATKDLLLNIERQGEEWLISVFATSVRKGHTLSLWQGETLLLKEAFDCSPENIFNRNIPAQAGVREEELVLQITDATGKELLRYEPGKNRKNEYPEPAKAAILPREIGSNEELYLTGLHLEQYRHATYPALPYYEEAIRRDPKDARNNNAVGLWYLRRGQFKKSEPFFRKALETLTRRNSNPYDGEPFYNLGLCLKWQYRPEEAYEHFYKACWSSAWQDKAYFSLAQLDMAKGKGDDALDHLRKSLEKNTQNAKARALRATVYRRLGQAQQSLEACAAGLENDAFNLSLYFEQYKNHLHAGEALAASHSLAKLRTLARGDAQNFIEYALDYEAAGLYEDAIEFLQLYVDGDGGPAGIYPMAWYYLGYWHHRRGKKTAALASLKKGAAADAGLCFPNRLEDIAVLQFASAVNEADAKAPYYLGNLWYDKRQYDEAIGSWELSAERDPSFPTVFRNLGIAFFNRKGNAQKAQEHYRKAFLLDPFDARVLMELDQLSRRVNTTPSERLDFLEQHLQQVDWRDDLVLERSALYNFAGEFDTAFGQIMERRFHPWEGGEGKVSSQYVYSLTEMAKRQILDGQYEKAIDLLEQAQVFPHNLGEGKLAGTRENDLFYWLGIAYERLSRIKEAEDFFHRAAEGQTAPAAAIFYNDQQPDKIFYQGLALKKLGDGKKAERIFAGLIEYGDAHLNDKIRIDYFAVSLPDLLLFEDDLDRRNKTHCYYMKGLGFLGAGRQQEAAAYLQKVLEYDPMHFGAKTHLSLMSQWKEQVNLLMIQNA
jgi:tetratricopeptide (TPR) repeat protein